MCGEVFGTGVNAVCVSVRCLQFGAAFGTLFQRERDGYRQTV